MIKKLILTLSFLLVASVASSVPTGFGTTGGFGGQLPPPESLLGVKLGDGPPSAQTLNATTFVQVPLGAVEFLDTGNGFEISSDGNLICNSSGEKLTGAQLSMSASVGNVNLATWSFNVRFGICQDCILDTFPQLDDTNDFTAIDMPVSFRNQVPFDDAVLVGPIQDIGPDDCIGILMQGDAANNVVISGGTFNIYGSRIADGAVAQGAAQTILDLDDVGETTFIGSEGHALLVNEFGTGMEFGQLSEQALSTGTFDGTGAAVNVTDAAWVGVELKATIDETFGVAALELSTDRNLLCNNSGSDLRGTFNLHAHILQSSGGVQDLRVRMGERSGEGALSDGDEISTEDQASFTGSGTKSSITVQTAGVWADGNCRGLMLRRLNGMNKDYSVEFGNYAANFFTVIEG